MIEKKSLKAWGRDYKISPHFTLKEMACKDGSDLVLYSEELLAKLEELRAYVGGSVVIVSGYRTKSHNKKSNGAKYSQHLYGTAADISVKVNGQNLSGKLVCCLCQSLGFRGIGYMSETSTHVDMRTSGSYRGDERKGYDGNVGGDFYKYFGVKKSQIDALKAAIAEPKSTPAEPATTPKIEEKTEDEEMIYKTVSDVPNWGKAAVQLRVNHGWSDGKNLPESLVRAWVEYDRKNPYFANVNDVPSWAQKDIKELIDSGVIKGKGTEEVAFHEESVRLIVIFKRMLAKG